MCYNCDIFVIKQLLPQALYHNNHTWTFFELILNFSKNAGLGVFENSNSNLFWTTITITQAIITTIIHLFSNTYFKEADTPTFVI